MTDLLQEVIVTTRGAFPRLPDLQVIERPGWLQIITPSIKTGGLNEVIYSRLDQHSADAAMDAAIAMYRDRDLKFRWLAGPDSGPADLCARLEARGLTRYDGRGMARSTDDAQPTDNIVVVDATTLGDFTHVMAHGWNSDVDALAALHRHMFADRRYAFFLAYCDGQPVAGASAVSFARSMFLQSGVVLPSHRGRGLYRALVQARLAHARACGIALATTHAREATSAPILERLGFDTVCRFPMYYG